MYNDDFDDDYFEDDDMYNDDFDDDYFEDDDMYFEYTLDLETIPQINAALSNLINYSYRIYDLTVGEMYKLEKSRLINSEKYEQCLKRLKILKLKEQRILDNLTDTINYGDFDDYINSLADELIYDKDKKEAIKQRITYMFEKIAAENNAYCDRELSSEFAREYYYTKDMYLNFLNKIKGCQIHSARVLKNKYVISFTNPDVETELLYAGYKIENIIRTKEEDKHKFLNIEAEVYETEKKEFYYDFAAVQIDTLVKQTKDSEKNCQEIYNSLDLIKFLLKKVSTKDLYIIQMKCEDKVEEDMTTILYDDISVVDKLIELCLKELEKRKDIENDKIEENINVESLSEELIDNLFNLIKQDSKIYDISMKLCSLEINGKKDTKKFEILINELEELINKEKEIVTQINITSRQKDVVYNLLNTSINIIAGLNGYPLPKSLESLCDNNVLNNRNEVIKQRILNLIPELYFMDDSVYPTADVPTFIIQKHLIEVLKEFEKNINEVQDKAPLILVKYETLLANSDLLDDFVNVKGKVEDIILFDDETLATLLNIDLEEYQFDKSELLSNYVLLISQGNLENPIENPTSIELARMEFQGVYINVAMDNITDEQIKTMSEDELKKQELQKIKIKEKH